MINPILNNGFCIVLKCWDYENIFVEWGPPFYIVNDCVSTCCLLFYICWINSRVVLKQNIKTKVSAVYQSQSVINSSKVVTPKIRLQMPQTSFLLNESKTKINYYKQAPDWMRRSERLSWVVHWSSQENATSTRRHIAAIRNIPFSLPSLHTPETSSSECWD